MAHYGSSKQRHLSLLMLKTSMEIQLQL